MYVNFFVSLLLNKHNACFSRKNISVDALFKHGLPMMDVKCFVFIYILL